VSVYRNLGLRESGGLSSSGSSLYVVGGGSLHGVVPGSSALCARLGGLSPGQRRFCQLYEDHMFSVASGVRLAVSECQRQFRFRRWNCSTVNTLHADTAGNTNVTSSLFGHVIDTGQFRFKLHNKSKYVWHIRSILTCQQSIRCTAWFRRRHNVFWLSVREFALLSVCHAKIVLLS